MAKCTCELCELSIKREEALKSDDIDVVKAALKEFSDLWLCISEDLSYCKSIIDGSWPTADEIIKINREKRAKK